MSSTDQYNRIEKNPLKISKAGRKIYVKLYNILNESDRFQSGDEYNLTILSEALADYDECRIELEENGKFYNSGTLRRVSPAWSAQQDILKIIKELTTAFKLSPKHREKGEGVSQGDDPFMLINKALKDAN